jgi:hypothetical protein
MTPGWYADMAFLDGKLYMLTNDEDLLALEVSYDDQTGQPRISHIETIPGPAMLLHRPGRPSPSLEGAAWSSSPQAHCSMSSASIIGPETGTA